MGNYRMMFQINDLPKPINAVGGHWRHRNNEAKKWRNIIFNVTLGKRPKTPLTKAKLELTRYSSRSPDYDGLVSSFKHVVDGLITSGVIESDTLKVIGIPKFDWVYAKQKAGRIEVKVFEVDKADRFHTK